MPTWTPKVCKIMAFVAIIMGLGLLFYILLEFTLRVQVPNRHILTQNLYYNYYYPEPKYLIIGYLDP